MRKSEANKYTDAQIAQWTERNREPGVLPCIPVILINQLCGEKQGITMNFNPHLPLEDMAAILKSAADQVDAKLAELKGN